jgi:hypothetical protein
MDSSSDHAISTPITVVDLEIQAMPSDEVAILLVPLGAQAQKSPSEGA